MISIKVIAVLMISFFSLNTGIHSFSVPKIEGGSESLASFSTKRLLIVTLPLDQGLSSDSLLYSLDTLAAAHQGTLQVIAVPSYEDGYTIDRKAALKNWYRSKLGTYITVCDGLYTRKSSGTQQHPLFKWLTNVQLNETLDIDVEGPGYKYFVRPNGELYGVLRTHVRMGSMAVNRTIKM